MTTTRDAETRPFLDLVDLAGVRDMVPAATNLLSSVDTRQLALMSAWGNPPVARSCYLRATGATTWTVPLRVPPGVTEMDFAYLAWGSGSVAVTCSADATGSKVYFGLPDDESRADWAYTSGPADPAGGATSGRSVIVSAAAVWAYQDVDLTVVIDDVASPSCGILALLTSPVWQPWTV